MQARQEPTVLLELQGIKKDYITGSEIVHALKGIKLQFRKSEFVSILGPSGCGKTTMLNIVGGLDHYTQGDLTINGISTKNYSERDWDAYRNHAIGFVFQSYNLIPHQTVLQNVELALTLSGVSKNQRKIMAKNALEQVGLGDQIKKRPAQLSGGQMQRVAIARALVNNPDIILADEPTGALDSETSVQVMDILKKVSKDKLVIMVTHNPDLADKYSTRIINMLDGLIINDSNPPSQEELAVQPKQEIFKGNAKKTKKKAKKPTMSIFTSFMLSLKNLFSKKGRTILTSFAGSVGIIGIALIYAVSQGATSYINMVQEETLGSYPLTLEAEHTNLGSILEKFMSISNSTSDHKNDAVYEQSALFDIINALNSAETQQNDLKSFKKHLEEERAKQDSLFNQSISGVQYTYGLDLSVYTQSVDDKIICSDAQQLLGDLLKPYLGDMLASMEMLEGTSFGGMTEMYTSTFSVWEEMLSGDNGRLVSPLLEKQYNLVYGSWPTEYNEIVLVLDKNNELDDMTLYSLGLKEEEQVKKILDAVMKGETVEKQEPSKSWSYKEISEMKFRILLNADCYQQDPITGNYIDITKNQQALKVLYNSKGIDLKVSGIIKPNADSVAHMLSGSIGYTSKLTEYVIENSKQSQTILAQQQQPDTDIFTGKLFKNSDLSDQQKADIFRDYVQNLTKEKKSQLYIDIMSIPPEEVLQQAVQEVEKMPIEQMKLMLIEGIKNSTTALTQEQIEEYINSLSDEALKEYIILAVKEQATKEYAQGVQTALGGKTEQNAMLLNMAMQQYSDEQCAAFYESVMEFSESSYQANMEKLGYIELDNPETINLYATTFENKELIEQGIKAYNKGLPEEDQIKYVDYVGLMMSSITTIINAITYVLIAFVAVSLVVSSIMIGVITLISVQERTKEIGILRSLGASKRNVSSLFNAETILVGFFAGLIGVGVTYLLCIPINLILHTLTGINNLSAILPIPFALILISLSVILTLIAGIIPSRSAAKKDPVVALRTE